MSSLDVADGDVTPTPEHVSELVRSLALVMREAAVTELDVELGQLSIRLRRPEQAEPPGRAQLRLLPDADTSGPEPGYTITAPMVGTFYAAPTPSAPPFVTVGDEVLAGQTIGIIEAMKIMNEVAADRSGMVIEVMAGNGQPVEFGSPLLRLAATHEHQ